MTADVFIRQLALGFGYVHVDELGVKAIFLTEAKVLATDRDAGVAFQWSRFRKDLNQTNK